MHIVCALWNKDIDNTVEPYPVPESRLNKQVSGSIPFNGFADTDVHPFVFSRLADFA